MGNGIMRDAQAKETYLTVPDSLDNSLFQHKPFIWRSFLCRPWRCVYPINSNEKPRLIKGEREMLRFRVTVKGCSLQGCPPLASFHGKLEERG